MSQVELATETAKAVPVVGYAGLHFAGVSIADIVSLVTLVYVVCLCIVTVPKAYNQVKEWFNKWRSKQD